LNGRWHGVVADKPRRTVTLFNDRYGIHRLYFHDSGDALYFASEAKALLSVRPELREIDSRGLGELLSLGCVLENRTIFRGVEVLPPASRWRFRQGQLESQARYFTPEEWEKQDQADPETWYRDVRDVFAQSLPRYFEGSEPIAMSLTGGLDTRMVMAWHHPPPGTLPCYTFGGMFRECHDVVVARRLAATCGQSHHVIDVGADFLARFGEVAERTVYLTDGFADVSRSPDLFVNQVARTIAPIRMTGNYGGEVLRRVRAFKPLPPAVELFAPELVRQIGAAADTYRRVIDCHPLSFAVFRQAPWHHFGLLALEQTQLTLRSPYLDNDFVQAVFRAPAEAVTSEAVCLRLIAEGNPALLALGTDRGPVGDDFYSRASRSVIQFQRNAEYAYDYGMPHAVARIDSWLSILRLERLFLGRHKFFHFRLWYRDALSHYVREILLDRRTLSRPVFRRQAVERIVSDHVSGRRNHTIEIHKLLTTELIHRLFVDPGRLDDVREGRSPDLAAVEHS
jgi:asparagine synthase (glutamine-hydrolysing)